MSEAEIGLKVTLRAIFHSEKLLSCLLAAEPATPPKSSLRFWNLGRDAGERGS